MKPLNGNIINSVFDRLCIDQHINIVDIAPSINDHLVCYSCDEEELETIALGYGVYKNDSKLVDSLLFSSPYYLDLEFIAILACRTKKYTFLDTFIHKIWSYYDKNNEDQYFISLLKICKTTGYMCDFTSFSIIRNILDKDKGLNLLPFIKEFYIGASIGDNIEQVWEHNKDNCFGFAFCNVDLRDKCFLKTCKYGRLKSVRFFIEQITISSRAMVRGMIIAKDRSHEEIYNLLVNKLT